MPIRFWLALCIALSAPVAAHAQDRQVPDSQAEVQLSFAPVVRQVTPAVVNVYATRVTQQAVSPFANDPFFSRFFGGRSPFFNQRPRESQSLGSGVVVDPAGVILTNSHVVDSATDIRISMADGREYAVDMVLNDPETDLAVLRIRDPGDATFPALSFADSDALQVGDLVLAVGNPFGVGQTVTSGIVSALSRTGVESSDYEFFIQTDAAINPGNSGGALVDLRGQLVGINTAIFTRSGGSIGIGFAIPSNMARVIADAGVAGGAVIRPWLGARLQGLTSDLANSLGLDRPRGALVAEVVPDSPAARAGLQAGDVITAIDGAAVDNPRAFEYRLATRTIGEQAEVTMIRAGAPVTATLAVETAPEVSAGDQVTIGGQRRFSGTTVADLTPALALDMGLALDSRGVVVLDVADGSRAQRMGLRRGDIIVSLQGTDVSSASQFQTLADQQPRAWEIAILRDGRIISSVVGG